MVGRMDGWMRTRALLRFLRLGVVLCCTWIIVPDVINFNLTKLHSEWFHCSEAEAIHTFVYEDSLSDLGISIEMEENSISLIRKFYWLRVLRRSPPAGIAKRVHRNGCKLTRKYRPTTSRFLGGGSSCYIRPHK